ncbi:MAG: arsenate reductase (glutaredoxin) [Rhodospirillales bacterium]
MDIVIYHNPDCETSRNVLAVLRCAGYEPEVVEYLQAGWTIPQLRGLFAAVGLSVRQCLRISRSPAEELGLLDESVDDDTLLAAMVQYPILVNRPFVCTPKGVRLCRPSETVFDLMDRLPPGPFYKEDGELLIDHDGVRVDTLADADYRYIIPGVW